MKCRLLYVVGQLRAGGLERQLYYLLRTIDRQRYLPAVAVWNFQADRFYTGRFRELGVPIFYPPSTIPGVFKLSWFRSLARALRPAVIHSYSFHTNCAALTAAAGTSAIAVGSVRSSFARAKRKTGFLLGRLNARWPRVQVYNSKSAAEEALNAHHLFTPGTIRVVRNGIDLERFIRTPLPTSSPAIVLAVGSLTAVKRWDRLLDVASVLNQRQLPFRLKIVGNGPQREALERQASELRIAEHVEFLGLRTDIPELLSEATLLAHTSDSEGCPNVVMEAMACGRPVVASSVGDVPRLVADGETGFVVTPGEATVIAERVHTVLTDRSLRERMSVAARRKAENEFGLERLLTSTFDAYRAAGWQDSDIISLSHEPGQNHSSESADIVR